MHRAALAVPLLLLSACAPRAGETTAGPSPSPAPAAPTVDRGAFVVRMGTDTLAVETYTRTAERLTGELVIRDPRTATRSYTAELRPDGSVARLEVRLQTTGAAPALSPYTYTYDFRGDTAHSVFVREAERETARVGGAERAIPMLRYSFALQQLALDEARRGGTGSASLLPVAGREMLPFTARPLGGDSLRVTTSDGAATAWTDAAGRIVRYDGSGSNVKVIAERVPTADVAALAADFARRDVEGRGIGALSPRDSVSARIGAANVSVAYGRPSRRGRQVLGLLVPWNQVWRAGANLITRLSTDRELRVGDAWLPAGSYGLFTVARSEGWTLVVSRMTGVSGTAYDPGQDVVRIPMAFAAGQGSVERFTIAVEPAGSGGTLRLSWDNWVASVPLRTR